MEEIFEALIAVAVIVFAIARKNAKKQAAKKDQKPEKPAHTMPKDAFDIHEVDIKADSAKDAAVKVVKAAKQVVLEEILEIKTDDEDEEARPSLEHAPVHRPSPVSATPAAAIPVHPGFAAIAAAVEGDCPHPEHEPMPRHEAPKKREPARVEERKETLPSATHVRRRFDSAAMRRAVVTAEILNRPVALRQHGRRA